MMATLIREQNTVENKHTTTKANTHEAIATTTTTTTTLNVTPLVTATATTITVPTIPTIPTQTTKPTATTELKPKQKQKQKSKDANRSILPSTNRKRRPVYTLPCFHSPSVTRNFYQPTSSWSAYDVTEMYAELRHKIGSRYSSAAEITGFERFKLASVNGLSFGHFCVSQIVLHNQQRYVPTSASPYPPVPTRLRRLFQVLRVERKTSKEASKQALRDAKARLEQLQIDASRQRQQRVFFKAETKRLKLNTQPAMPEDYYTRLPAVMSCTLSEVRCNLYVIKYGLGVTLGSHLPNGQTVAAFATQYEYTQHIRRMHRRRDQYSKRRIADNLAPLPPKMKPLVIPDGVYRDGPPTFESDN